MFFLLSSPRPKNTTSKPIEEDPNHPKNLPIRQYLDETVVPLLLQAMTEVSKERPQDPIQYIVNYLYDYQKDTAMERGKK